MSSHVSRRREHATTQRQPTRSAFPAASKQKELIDEANSQAIKLQRDWATHARVLQQSINSIWAREGRDTDTDQFMKKLALETVTRPPSDFAGRMKIALDMLRQRYNLNDEQVKRVQGLIIRRTFEIFMRHSEALLPISREIIDTRLAGKPFTPEQVQRWAKAIRPIAEKVLDQTKQDIQTFGQTYLDPEQNAKLKADMVVIEKRVNERLRIIREELEKGKWSPERWGLENDPVHAGMQARLAETRGQHEPADTSAKAGSGPETAARQPAEAPPSPVSIGPPRIGDSRGGTVKVYQQQESSPLPDETKWVAYVQQFCDRYELDQSQRTSAFAVLRDLQERAQSYRSSRIDQINKLEAVARNADTADERRDAQSALREILRGIDELFEELKARLESIPTGDQIRRAG